MDNDYLEVEERRQPPWYLLTGVVIGLGLGLLVSLVLSPVRYIQTAPASLSAPYQDDYRLLIAQSYVASGDLTRAQQRLALFGADGSAEALAAQAQRLLSEGGSLEDARALAHLATLLYLQIAALGSTPTQTPFPPSATPEPSATPKPSSTPQPTFTPRSSPTLLPTQETPFTLTNWENICDPALPAGLMQIYLWDAAGAAVPGVQITVAWESGIDTFYTGLKNFISPGYADFEMAAGVVYSIRVGDGGETYNDFTAPDCGDYAGGLLLEFSLEPSD